MLVGCALVTSPSDRDGQRAALTRAGVADEAMRFFESTVDDAVGDGGATLAAVLENVRAGDVVVVTRLTRLTPSADRFVTFASALAARDANLWALESALDTRTPEGAAQLQALVRLDALGFGAAG